MTNEEIKQTLISLEKAEIDFSVTQTGRASQKVNGLYKPATKEIRAAISSKPLTPSRESEKTSDSLASNLNITQEKSDVNELFSSLLLRGEITLLERKKDIENRNERYLDAVTSLEKLTPLIQSDSIKESNNKFVKKQKESRFYKDVQNLFVKTNHRRKNNEKH